MARGAYGGEEDRFFLARRAKGSLITDVDGNRFIDFSAGWATNNVGNGNPEVVEVVNRAMQECGVTCWTSNANSVQRLELAEKLLEVCPSRTDRRHPAELSGLHTVRPAPGDRQAAVAQASGRVRILAGNGHVR